VSCPDDDMDELRTRLDSLEESLESLHLDMEIVLAALDDRDGKPQAAPNTNERN